MNQILIFFIASVMINVSLQAPCSTTKSSIDEGMDGEIEREDIETKRETPCSTTEQDQTQI